MEGLCFALPPFPNTLYWKGGGRRPFILSNTIKSKRREPAVWDVLWTERWGTLMREWKRGEEDDGVTETGDWIMLCRRLYSEDYQLISYM